jgi:hypothetical protein
MIGRLSQTPTNLFVRFGYARPSGQTLTGSFEIESFDLISMSYNDWDAHRSRHTAIAQGGTPSQ